MARSRMMPGKKKEKERKLKQCEYCGTLMSISLFGGVCNECMDTDKELYDKARSSLKFGEKVLPEELADKTGIEIKHIKRWMEIGRFGIE